MSGAVMNLLPIGRAIFISFSERKWFLRFGIIITRRWRNKCDRVRSILTAAPMC